MTSPYRPSSSTPPQACTGSSSCAPNWQKILQTPGEKGASPHTLVTTPWLLVVCAVTSHIFCVFCAINCRHLTTPSFAGTTSKSPGTAGTRLGQPESGRHLSQFGWAEIAIRDRNPCRVDKGSVKARRKIGTHQRLEILLCDAHPTATRPSHTYASHLQKAGYPRSALKQTGSLTWPQI